jgi:hypothetical protein
MNPHVASVLDVCEKARRAPVGPKLLNMEALATEAAHRRFAGRIVLSWGNVGEVGEVGSGSESERRTSRCSRKRNDWVKDRSVIQ